MTEPLQPQIVHPIQYLPRLVTHTELQAFQHQAGHSQELAGWCGGQVASVDGQLAVRVGEDEYAYLGDYVMFDGQRYWVEPFDGPGGNFRQRYWPKGEEPNWDWRCYYTWEDQPA